MVENRDQADTYSEVVRAGLLPFAVAQELDLPCAYERSIKLTPAGILTNRYLLAIGTDVMAVDAAMAVCVQLGMPESYLAMFRRRYARASQFMMGFEEGLKEAVSKVYLESRGFGRPAVLSHVGWKWNVGPTTQSKITLYRRVHISQCASMVESFGGSSASATSELLSELVASRLNTQTPLVCLSVQEAGRCRGLDLNVYPLALYAESIAPWLARVIAEFGLKPGDYETVMSLCRSKRLGHLSVGARYLTIYYNALA